MNKALLIGALLLTGCSNCKQPEQCPPCVPTVVVPDASSPQPTTTSSVEPPAQGGIDWKTPEELVDIGRENPDICAMAYFPDIVNNKKEIEVTLADPEVVKFINETFVAIQFPLTPENLDLVMKEFQIDGLPTIMFAPPAGATVLHVKGHPPPEVLLGGLREATKEGAPFEKCAEIKAKSD
jgi:hypothetical protein